jgi:PIN domain nuclease of toxin-antitoxin system
VGLTRPDPAHVARIGGGNPKSESYDNLRVSVISIWELAMLEKRGRPMNVRTWVEQALSKPGIAVAPLTPEIAIESVHLPGEIHGDPADRMLVATARVLGATLVTKDAQLIRYSHQRHVRAIEA